MSMEDFDQLLDRMPELSTTCRKIEAFDGDKSKLRSDCLTFGDLLDQHVYSENGVLFQTCGKPAKGDL